jgi:8-oxo-dGTP pyrophosphatase MutT (NUDIX family)
VVADSELPILLPEVENYEPTGTGESPLAIIDSFKNVYGYINDEGEFQSAVQPPQDVENINGENMVSFINKGEDSAPREGVDTKFRNNTLCIIKNKDKDKYIVLDWVVNNWRTFVGGGVEDGEDFITSGVREIEEETGFADASFISEVGTYSSHFYNRNKNINYKTYTKCLYYEVEDKNKKEISTEETNKHKVLELEEKDVKKFFVEKNEESSVDYLLYH